VGREGGVLLAALVGAVVAFALGYLYWYGFRAPGEAVKPEVVGVRATPTCLLGSHQPQPL